MGSIPAQGTKVLFLPHSMAKQQQDSDMKQVSGRSNREFKAATITILTAIKEKTNSMENQMSNFSRKTKTFLSSEAEDRSTETTPTETQREK